MVHEDNRKIRVDDPRIGVRLSVGDMVRVYEEDSIIYEETVDRHVPQTGLIRMSDGTGKSDFIQMLSNAEHFEIIRARNDDIQGVFERGGE